MDREIWRGKDVGYIVKKKMNRSCRKNGMVSVNRWGFGSVNRAVKKGEGKEMDQEIKQRIETLKKEKDAVILAHYYVDGEVQEIADYVGDSYYLAELATTVPQKTIIFCGVSFMGESAKILSPEKTVIMADRSADCPMAHMVEVEKIREVRKEYPDVAVVCYVNSMAEIKAESDVCVTSSNALKIVKKLPNKDIFFIPDENLGRFTPCAHHAENRIVRCVSCRIIAPTVHRLLSGLLSVRHTMTTSRHASHRKCQRFRWDAFTPLSIKKQATGFSDDLL